METLSKTRAKFQTDEYFELELPLAPAVMVGEEILVEGADISEEKLENAIRQHFGLSPLEPEKKRK